MPDMGGAEPPQRVGAEKADDKQAERHDGNRVSQPVEEGGIYCIACKKPPDLRHSRTMKLSEAWFFPFCGPLGLEVDSHFNPLEK